MKRIIVRHQDMDVYKKAFEAAFVSKLNDSEAEAAESQTWLEFAVRCTYVSRDAASLYSRATMR
jgi:four helix bundle protein